MDILNTLRTTDLSRLDPNGGVLVCTAYWRPKQEDPDPEHPGEKAVIVSYLPVASRERCPCGSGDLFKVCCQPLPYWQPLCPNPDMQGYRPLAPQEVRFANVTADAVYTFLQKDTRLYCVQDTPPQAFWILWGDPAFEAPYGIHCFGDLELQRDRTLLVTALSEKRMEVLIDLLQPLKLGTPQIQYDPQPKLEKPRRQASGRKRRHSFGRTKNQLLGQSPQLGKGNWCDLTNCLSMLSQ